VPPEVEVLVLVLLPMEEETVLTLPEVLVLVLVPEVLVLVLEVDREPVVTEEEEEEELRVLLPPEVAMEVEQEGSRMVMVSGEEVRAEYPQLQVVLEGRPELNHAGSPNSCPEIVLTLQI